MEQRKIEMFLIQNSDKLPNEKIMMIKNALSQLEDSKFILIQTIEMKEPITILFLSAAIGIFAVDRFALGQIGLGLLKLFTLGGFYIWWIIDIINATKRTRNYNYQILKETLAIQGILIY